MVLRAAREPITRTGVRENQGWSKWLVRLKQRQLPSLPYSIYSSINYHLQIYLFIISLPKYLSIYLSSLALKINLNLIDLGGFAAILMSKPVSALSETCDSSKERQTVL